MELPVIETLQCTGLNPRDYLVFGGSALALRGIRPALDLDLMLRPEVFKEISCNMQTPGGTTLQQSFEQIDEGEEYRLISAEHPNDGFLPLDLRGLTKDEKLGRFAFRKWLARGDAIKTDTGVLHVMGLEDIVASKMSSVRLKDHEDITKIYEHIAWGTLS